MRWGTLLLSAVRSTRQAVTGPHLKRCPSRKFFRSRTPCSVEPIEWRRRKLLGSCVCAEARSCFRPYGAIDKQSRDLTLSVVKTAAFWFLAARRLAPILLCASPVLKYSFAVLAHLVYTHSPSPSDVPFARVEQVLEEASLRAMRAQETAAAATATAAATGSAIGDVLLEKNITAVAQQQQRPPKSTPSTLPPPPPSSPHSPPIGCAYAHQAG